MDKKPTSPGAKALVISLIMIVVSMGIYFAGTRISSALNYLTYGILLIGIIFSINQYAKEIQYRATFGNYFAHGFKVAAVVALIMIGYLLIFLFAFPEFKEKALVEIREEMLADKNSTPDQVEQGMEMVRKGFMLFAVGGSLLYYLLVGVIAALIGAAITKKKNDDFTRNINQTGS